MGKIYSYTENFGLLRNIDDIQQNLITFFFIKRFYIL